MKSDKLIDKTVKVCDFDGYGFWFTIYGIPFYLSVDPNIHMRFQANVEGHFYGGFKYEYEKEFAIGLRYDGDSERFSPIMKNNQIKNEFSFITPQANFEANASAALAFGVDVMIDKLTGPTIAFGPKVTANAEMNV